MNIKSEKSIKEYLKTLPDDTIIKYYLDVEFSPFPVLLIEEYTRRFKRKTKDEILKDIKFQTRLARKKTQDLTRIAKKHIAIDDITKLKSEEFISQAQKKGHTISDNILKKSGVLSSKLRRGTQLGIQKGINTSKNLTSSTADQLELLEKLSHLKKAGIITNKEFQEKKKRILSKI